MMKSKIIVFTHTSTDYEIQNKELDGVPHLVVPVVMMVEGVHNGSRGPLLYTTEELGRLVEAWDGIPVVVQHPQDGRGRPTSINDPTLTENNTVGRIHNTHMDGDKLKAEAWLNIAQIQNISQDAYDSIIEHQVLQVSIGAFHEEVDSTGNFNNEDYRAVATNLKPDHLALLPGVEGACNWDDGCGIRVNEKGTKRKGDSNEMKNLKTMSGKDLFKEGYTINAIVNHLTDNEVGFLEITRNLRQKVDQLDNDVRINFLEEVFDDELIYRVHNRETGDTSFFKRGYTVNEEDGTVDFTDADPVEVRKETDFVTVNEELKRVKSKINVKPKIVNSMKNKGTPCDIDGLIANEATQFTEENREWLSTLKQEELDLLSPVEAELIEEPVLKRIKPVAPVANTKGADDEPVKNELVTKNEDGVILINGKSIEKHFEELITNSDDPEKFIEKFMPAISGQLKSGLKMYKENRAKLVEGIVANSNFEATHLENWKDDDLQNLHDSVVKEEADYSAQGSIVTHSGGEADPELVAMTGIKPKEDN